MRNDKYVVFKKDDFEFGSPLEDAVVIRRQDIFAGPGLHAYAAAISTVIEMMDGGIVYEVVESQYRDQLIELRDFFHDMAVYADEHPHKKFPD